MLRSEPRTPVAGLGRRHGARTMTLNTDWCSISIILLAAFGTSVEAGQNVRALESQSRPPAQLDLAADHARPPGHVPHARPVPPPPAGLDSLADRTPPLASLDSFADRSPHRDHAAPLASEACQPSHADVNSAPRLTAYLRSLPYPGCINTLFNGPEDLRHAAFREEHVLYVMDTAAKLATTYNGTNSDNLAELFYFARAAFYNEFYDEDIAFTTDVYQAMMEALDEFVQNPRSSYITEQNGVVLRQVFVCLDSISHGYRVRYLPAVKAWLAEFGPQHAMHWHLLSATNALMVWFFRGHRDEDYLDVVLSDTEAIDSLRNLALSDHLLDDPRLSEDDLKHLKTVMANAARELTRFMEYESATIAPVVQDSARRILHRYDPLGEGASIWLAVADNVFHNDACDTYGICGADDEIERVVLSTNHSCSESVRIRAQSMTSGQLLRACDKLLPVEMFFHEQLGTNHEPVVDDLNSTLEIVVYTDWDNYNRYSSFLFDHSTNNGGIYLEGDPTDPANVARFFAYLADWLPDTPVWNLQHEYVHYLDGRFNLVGRFWDLMVFTHKTIWWTEGLAEYVSNLGGSSEVVSRYLEGSVPPLHEIFATTDYQNSALYPESHLAMWFMFERHEGDIHDFLQFFRAGDYDGYLDYLNTSIGDRYENEWRWWIERRLASIVTD